MKFTAHPGIRIIRRRLFLLNDLPAPLIRASRHLQFHDNYIAGTRLRLRHARFPQTKEVTCLLEQREPLQSGDFSEWRSNIILLNEAEYHAFHPFEGREIRKNRYLFDEQGREFLIDVYIGPLWGLMIARAEFETQDDQDEMTNLVRPEFAVCEVTQNPFFTDEHLVGKNFADVQAEFARITKGENA